MIKIFLFTMEGCPYCVEMKDLLSKDGIEYLEKDIVQHESEFDDFSTLVGGNEFVPALLCVKLNGNEIVNVLPLCPEKDFDELSDGVIKVKEFVNSNK